MHDAIELEARGVPTAVIITSEFVREAKVQREALGMSGVVPVVIEHPLSSLTEEQIRARVAAALPQVLAAWQGKLRDEVQ
jgi:hypothetical protein